MFPADRFVPDAHGRKKTQYFASGRFRTLSVVCSVTEIHRHFRLLALGSYGFGMAVWVARVEVVDV